MNDIVLSALLNLFALFGSDSRLDKDESLALITNYLKKHYGVRNPKSYLNLYSELRDYYDEFADIDKHTIIAGICKNLKGKILVSEQEILLLRLMEFCGISSSGFDPENKILVDLALQFGISKELYSQFSDFVAGRPGECVTVTNLPGDAGELRTFRFKDTGLLLFVYLGRQIVTMNDIPVMSGVFQTWQQSGVLKCRSFAPMYYSTIMAKYIDKSEVEMVELCGRDIDFRFNDGGNNGLHNFSFDLRSGQLVAIMGGSGVGKSTLMSLLNGTLRAQKGSITVNGHDIHEPEAKALIGYVPQDDLLIEDLTVYQNLWYTAKMCFEGLSDSEIDEKVNSVLNQLGLSAASGLKVGSPVNKYISGGQRKRLNIALELIREPAILFLDEPTSGLSSSDTEKVINILKDQTYKGKLIVANIHQPSSDVYKLFDRLWVLDTGGYPIFDGNPIDAISYFKTAANYADSQISACPLCGNVTPDVVLNIIDEKSLDNAGNITDKRKVSAKEWHDLYISKRQEMPEPEKLGVPDTRQRKPTRLGQTLIYLRRSVKAKLANTQYLLVTLFEAPILAVICSLLTHYTPDSGVYCIMDNKNLVSYYFMAIIVAIFLGMTGSAEEIIKDRALLKREKFLNLSYGSYIWSKIIYMAAVCMVQTVLFLLVGNFIMGIKGLFLFWWMILFISAFLSGLIGLLLSQCMNSVVSIYITIPLLLIPQILLCGLVVRFDDLNTRSETGNVPLVGDVIPSRWAYEALAVGNFTMNGFESQFYESDRDKYTAQYYEFAFLHELESELESEKVYTDSVAINAGRPVASTLIRTELPHLTQVCGMDPYDGKYDYASLRTYFDKAKKILSKRGNALTLALDRQVAGYISEYGKDALMELKRSQYNKQLENLVLNRDTERLCAVVGNHIVPRSGYIFLTPRSRNGRAPFYSGVKVVGHYEISTIWFNTFVLLFMCVLLSLCLFYDFPGRFVRKNKN